MIVCAQGNQLGDGRYWLLFLRASGGLYAQADTTFLSLQIISLSVNNLTISQDRVLISACTLYAAFFLFALYNHFTHTHRHSYTSVTCSKEIDSSSLYDVLSSEVNIGDRPSLLVPDRSPRSSYLHGGFYLRLDLRTWLSTKLSL